MGFDKEGYDKEGYNKLGFDKNGNNRYNLMVGQTVYHNTFGEGTIIGFESNGRHIKVDFPNQGSSSFIFPDSIGTFLFIDKTTKIIQREEFLSHKFNRDEDDYERKHFDRVCVLIDEPLKQAQLENHLSKYAFNDFSDSFDENAFSNYEISYKSLEYYRLLRREPFFARIDYKDKTGLYIGKNEIKDEVVDWADPICSLYYEYQIYIGNEKYDLSLVRNFDIVNSNYYGFTDTYFKSTSQDDSENISKTIITDPRLLMVLNANKEDKTVHDIISTIQANQYQIITDSIEKNLLVLGCAGSGKTMIMFHRLRYLLKNNKSLDIKSVFLISPTGLLNSESNNLSTTLQIQNANKLSTIEFEKYIVKLYYKDNKLFENICNKKLISNEQINSDFIKTQYSQQNIKNIISSLRSILEDNNGVKTTFIEEETIKIVNAISEYTNTKYTNYLDIINEKDKHFSLLEIYENACFELSDVSKENITAIISNMKYIQERKEKPQNKKYRISVLENLLNSGIKLGSTKRTKKGDVYINEDCLKKLFELYEKAYWNGGKNGTKNCIVGNENPIIFFKSYSEIIYQLNRIIDFKEHGNYAYLFNIVQSLIDQQKTINQISITNSYEYELYIHLCACQDIFKSLSNNNKLIFIDEFQDFSYTELDVYKKIFPNAIFNYYGDFNQCINIKGINSKTALENIDHTWGCYEILENYRNAYDITQYVNKKFNMNMMPIGIKGSVSTVKFSLDIFRISSLDDRIACIMKDVNDVAIQFKDFEQFNIIKDADDQIIRGKINIIPVTLVKGLEFEQVYVVPKDMSQNEEYVAYTRALNELYILN